MTKLNYTPHKTAFAAILVLGNALILTPRFSVINLILSLALLFLINAFLVLGEKSKAVYVLTTFAVCAVAVYGFISVFFDYLSFLRAEQMPRTSVFLSAAVFLVTVAVLVKSKTEAFYKYCLLAFIGVVAVILLCFFGGIKVFEYKNFNLKQFSLAFSPKEFLKFFSSVAILPFYEKTKARQKKPFIFGVILGFLMLLIATLQVGLTLGADANLPYRYLKAVSVISSGSLFTRLDGLVWLLFFVTALIKAAACIKLVCEFIKKSPWSKPRG